MESLGAPPCKSQSWDQKCMLQRSPMYDSSLLLPRLQEGKEVSSKSISFFVQSGKHGTCALAHFLIVFFFSSQTPVFLLSLLFDLLLAPLTSARVTFLNGNPMCHSAVQNLPGPPIAAGMKTQPLTWPSGLARHLPLVQFPAFFPLSLGFNSSEIRSSFE